MAKASSRGVKLFCWLFMVVGFVALGAGAWTLIKSLRTTSWPVTEGVITATHIASHSGEHGSTYSPKVAYTYRVAGVSYDGDKIAIGQMSSSSDYARKVLQRYLVGQKIAVHYSPTNPAEAVLETGIHGGAWIAIAVGTVFVLFATMFLQIQRAAARVQLPGAPPSSVRTNPDGSISMDKPPVLMGVIFLLAGVGICFLTPSAGTPHWIVYAAGGMFGVCGVFILLYQLENKAYSKIAQFAMLALFLAIFHWVSFGSGERIGTSSTPFSTHSGVNVRRPFAIFTGVLDLIIIGSAIRWLIKRTKD